ncbi:hypothetical protein C8R44DRAFT_865237 [Mycena epipterygia]|nr:hypothetical protein C8R44DRAFT_865237 [Mycena epipterygia]
MEERASLLYEDSFILPEVQDILHPATFRLVLFEDMDPLQNQITVHIPSVQTPDAYILEFVSVKKINEVFATSAPFEILPAV